MLLAIHQRKMFVWLLVRQATAKWNCLEKPLAESTSSHKTCIF